VKPSFEEMRFSFRRNEIASGFWVIELYPVARLDVECSEADAEAIARALTRTLRYGYNHCKNELRGWLAV
jgi:hypothetical protein